MDLWIRSQNRHALIPYTPLYVCKYFNFYAITNYPVEFPTDSPGQPIDCTNFGIYKTEERALEVLDEIQELLKPKSIIQNISLESAPISDLVYRQNEQYTITPLSNVIVYEMPEE